MCDISPRHFVLWHLSYPKSNKKLDDHAAVSGEAMVFEGTPGWPSQSVEFKLAGLTHTLTPSDFPRDGQYHLYKLGRTRLLGNDAV